MQLLTGGVVVHSFGAVEHDQLTAGDLVQQQAAHGVVAGVGQGGGAVGGGDALVDDPVFRQGVCQFLHQPHTVVLDDHPSGSGLPLQFGEILGVHLRLVLQHLYGDAGEGKFLFVVLLFALLADQQQGLVAGVKVGVLKGLLNEFGLAAFQKAHKQVDRNFFCHRNGFSLSMIHPLCSLAAGAGAERRKRGSAAEQLCNGLFVQLGADDTSLPPTSAPRARTSHSPGT